VSLLAFKGSKSHGTHGGHSFPKCTCLPIYSFRALFRSISSSSYVNITKFVSFLNLPRHPEHSRRLCIMEAADLSEFLSAAEESSLDDTERPSRKQKTCTVCASPPYGTQHLCKVCLDAKYCSNECLETDEDAHSLICRSFNRIPRKRTPVEQRMPLVRALVFEAGQKRRDSCGLASTLIIRASCTII